MIKYEMNPGFECMKDFILNVHELFPDFETTLQNKRNHVKVAEHKGIKLCIKSFGNNNPVNRIAYSFIRPSKAERSYNYALKLLHKNIKTPEPVAYVEYFDKNRVLSGSYYISLYQEHDFNLTDAFDLELSDRLNVLAAFARYACNKLHNNGILHKDLSANNILVKVRPDETYDFYLIDLNRIRFRKKLSFRQRMANLKRIDGTIICLGTIAHFYAMEYKVSPVYGALKLGIERHAWLKYKERKRKLKWIAGTLAQRFKKNEIKEATVPINRI